MLYYLTGFSDDQVTPSLTTNKKLFLIDMVASSDINICKKKILKNC